MLVFVSERPFFWRETANHLNRHGVFLFLTPYRTAMHYCKTRATGGVVIDCIRNLKRGETLCRTLRERYPELPIAVLLSPKAIPDLPATCWIRVSDTEDVTSSLLEFCIRQCAWNTEKISTHALSMEQDPAHTRYMGAHLPLSPAEHRILRCLFYRAPMLTSPKDLMRLCYPAQAKHVNNLAVHVQAINQKALEIDPRPLIVNERSKGYRLRDGILL
ncbi:MAG: helix-turn-helix domain-containing protein [Clostridia bacterium]|nr:helix-turn-helix domain-containing protein [Clostridia bacterium]